jgi:hypothetical protein
MRTVAFAFLALAASSLHAQTTVAGQTPGALRVTESGAAEYRIPIRVPPGIAGLEPKLALAYNSQGGNGLLGVGWNLEGLSAITRCPRTMAQDGARGGVNYDANDRFCLDGQRLIATSGAYGADGTEYRTERESFTKVISYGTAGTGPAWFKAWTKGGQAIEYGNTAGNTSESRVEAQNELTVRVWTVNRISDAKQNALTFTYTRNKTTGEHYPARIDYAISGGDPNASVRFVYSTRTDTRRYYEAGSAIQIRERLTNVRTYVDETVVTDYQVAYDNGGVAGRSRVTAIKECAAGNVCRQAMAFAPQPPHTSVSLRETWTTATFNPNANWFTTGIHPRVWLTDVNGDGRTDILGITDNHVGVQLSTGSTFAPRETWSTTTFNPNSNWFDVNLQSRVWIGDVTGDGLPDIIGIATSGAYVQRNTGTAFLTAENWSPGTPADTFSPAANWFTIGYHPRVWLVDVNGDGRQDLLGIADNHVGVQLSTGTGFTARQVWATSTFNPSSNWFDVGMRPRVWVSDVTGDGLPDIVGVATNGVWVQVNTGSAFLPAVNWATLSFSPSANWFTTGLHPRVWLVDVNGDGRSDLLGITDNFVGVQLSTGKSFAPREQWAALTMNPGNDWFDIGMHQRVWIADVTGDGLPDVVGVANNAVRVQVNTGSSFLPPETWATATFNPSSNWFTLGIHRRVWMADVTGNGMADIVGLTDNHVSVQKTQAPSGQSVPDTLSIVTGSLGEQVTLAYKWMTDSTVYTKDSGTTAAAYPMIDLQVARPLVASSVADDGIGGERALTHAYGGFKADAEGRGILGFRWQESGDLETGLKSRTETRQDWPYVGVQSVVKTTQGSGAVLSETTNILACTNPADGSPCSIAPGNRYFPHSAQSTHVANDLNGAPLPTVTTSTQYDAFGNATYVVVSTPDGYSKTSTNAYANDTINWLLGRLTRSTVQSTKP